MKPILQALVLAERVYTDVSGRRIIAGTFNRVQRFAGKPAPDVVLPDGTRQKALQVGTDPGCPSIYISLTDVASGTEIALQFVDVSRNRNLFQSLIKLHSTNKLETTEIVVPLPRLTDFMQESGTYAFDVVWQGEILGSHRVIFETDIKV